MQRRAGVSGQGAARHSPFVGRARELALLHERLAHVAQGHGQVIGIGGWRAVEHKPLAGPVSLLVAETVP